MEQHVQVHHDILEQLKTELDLLKKVVMGDESWIFEYDPLTKRPSLEWKSATSPSLWTRIALLFWVITKTQKSKAILVQSKGDVHFFHVVRGVVHMEFLPQGQAINQHIYKGILQHLM